MNPNEAVKNYMNNLMELYIEDYGSECSKLLRERIKKTMYIFDSLPVDEVNFFEENKQLTEYAKKADLTFLECRDFYNKKMVIDERFNQEYYNALASAFGVNNRFIDELFSLDIDSYSLDNQIALGDWNISDLVKEEIRQRQDDYQAECKRLGIKCLTNSKTIKELFELQDDLNFETNFYLCRNTKWAKRIKKKIFEEKKQCISDIDLTELLFYGSSGSCNLIDTGRKEKLRICYFPLLANVFRGNLDGMFFHENRHVVEMTDGFAGFQYFQNNSYSSLNEIRTEKNAIRDKKSLEEKVLFSNNDYFEGIFNVYESLFQHTGSFVDKYLGVLNKIAVRNDVRSLERLFGRKALRKFDVYLHSIQEATMSDCADMAILFDESLEKQLVKRLHEHYKSRH